jgi:hypothetical protein
MVKLALLVVLAIVSYSLVEQRWNVPQPRTITGLVYITHDDGSTLKLSQVRVRAVPASEISVTIAAGELKKEFAHYDAAMFAGSDVDVAKSDADGRFALNIPAGKAGLSYYVVGAAHRNLGRGLFEALSWVAEATPGRDVQLSNDKLHVERKQN